MLAEKILNWAKVGIIIAVVVLAFQVFKACNDKDDPTIGTEITPLKTHTPTPDEQEVVPEGHTAIGTIKPIINPNPLRWLNSDTAVVVSADNDCNTCLAFTQKTDTKLFLGVSLHPKAFVGWNNHGLTAGYDQELFRWGRFSLDAIVGFPLYVGPAIGCSITNNTFALIGPTFDIIQVEDLSDPQTYRFNLNEFGTANLTIGLGFFF